MWPDRPFVRIFLLYALGIVIAKCIPLSNIVSVFVQIICIIALLITAINYSFKTIGYKYQYIYGFISVPLIILAGILSTSLHVFNLNNVTNTTDNSNYLGKIIDSPVETERSIKAVVYIKTTDSTSVSISKSYKAICFFEKDDRSQILRYGDVFAFRGSPVNPPGPANPGEFDYSSYLKQNGIIYSVYLKSDRWTPIDYNPSNRFIAFAGKLRNQLLHALQENGLKGDNYAVAAAVLLGYDNNMENDLKGDYIMAGAMHILCVSGLHVGIIYLVLNFIFGFLNNNKTGNLIKAILLLLFIWTYATITGLSPSVQRASLMISVFIIGDMFKRHRDTYNTLAVSATLLLIINPFLLFNVGYQLSYAAVLGIITFHKPIYNLIYFKNKIADKLWSVTVLSFAAQLATFPIATYYFHFFPPWFWLSNFITFPLSFLIIAGGLVFVAVNWIPFVSTAAGWILSKLVFILNYSVGMISYLPFAGLDNIYTSFPMAISLYMIMIITYLIFKNKNGKLLIPLLICIGIASGLVTYRSYKVHNQKYLVVYNVKKHTVIEFIKGDKQIILSDSVFINNSDKIQYHLKNSRTMWGLDFQMMVFPENDTALMDLITTAKKLVTFDNINILINNSGSNYYPTNPAFNLDYLVISGNTYTDLVKMVKAFKIGCVILDSSVSKWNRKKLRKSCRELGLTCYDVDSAGAFVQSLN